MFAKVLIAAAVLASAMIGLSYAGATAKTKSLCCDHCAPCECKSCECHP